MSRVLSFRRWVVAVGVAGALAGTMLGAGARSAEAAMADGGGYDCKGTSSCEAGDYNCQVQCYPTSGCSCTISDPPKPSLE